MRAATVTAEIWQRLPLPLHSSWRRDAVQGNIIAGAGKHGGAELKAIDQRGEAARCGQETHWRDRGFAPAVAPGCRTLK